MRCLWKWQDNEIFFRKLLAYNFFNGSNARKSAGIGIHHAAGRGGRRVRDLGWCRFRRVFRSNTGPLLSRLSDICADRLRLSGVRAYTWVSRVIHGDIPTALHFNVLIPIWTLIFAGSLVSLLLYAVRGRGLSINKLSPHLLWVFMIVLLTFGVLRNIPAYPFTLLFP